MATNTQCREVVAGSAVVHTDDIAWWHSRFGWTDLFTDGVLQIPCDPGTHFVIAPPRAQTWP
jgi:hypothetical protein